MKAPERDRIGLRRVNKDDVTRRPAPPFYRVTYFKRIFPERHFKNNHCTVVDRKPYKDIMSQFVCRYMAGSFSVVVLM